MWSGALSRGPEGRLGPGKTGGAAPGAPQKKMLPGSILVLMPALSSGPPGPGRGVASEVGAGGDRFLDGVTGESRAHTHVLTHSCTHTHTLPGHMGTAGAPHSRGRPPPAPNILSHTHTHTSHGLGPQLGTGAGSHSGGGGPVLGVSTQGHPPSRIPGSIWGAGEPDPPARLAKAREQQRGRLDGQTEGWTEPLVLGKLINRFVRGPLCGLGAKPRGQELVD